MTSQLLLIYAGMLVVAFGVALGIRRIAGEQRLKRARPLIVAAAFLPLLVLLALRH